MRNNFKSSAFYFLILFLFSTSCSLFEEVCKDGNGSVIRQEIVVLPFRTVESRGSFKVAIFQNSAITQQTVTVSAQENIIDLIKAEILGQSLIIDTDECYNSDEEVLITIQTPALSRIALSGSGDIVLQDEVFVNSIEFVLNGSGNIRTTPNFPIIATNCTIKLKGSGNVELDIQRANQVNAAIDGSGNITLRGTASSHSLNISGSGTIKAFSLSVLKSISEIIGSGTIEMNVLDVINTPSQATLNARISGSGKILVKGNAVIESDISGSGTIEQVE